MILEQFDPDTRAIINADMLVKKIDDFPEVTISCFSRHLFEEVLSYFEPKLLYELSNASGKSPVYEITYKDHRFAIYHSFVGEPACVGIYEEVLALGSKRLILLGNCGVLDKSIEDCGIIIPTKAIRDEGTSYHYEPASDYIEVNKKYKDLFKEVLEEAGYPFIEGITWTTDALYRETKEKVKYRKEQGAIAVEMECAGMQALCNFKETEFFQFFYAGDNLDHESWDPRSISGSTKLDEKSKIMFLAFEFGHKILEQYSE